MTKQRAPLTTDHALARIIGQLPGGYAEAAVLTERSESLVRAWGDPDRRESIPFDDAIALDIAYKQAGGLGSPFAELAQLRVEVSEHFADRFELLARAEKIVKEGGEANSALLRACQPGASAREWQEALRELQELIEEVHPALAQLESGPDRARAPP